MGEERINEMFSEEVLNLVIDTAMSENAEEFGLVDEDNEFVVVSNKKKNSKMKTDKEKAASRRKNTMHKAKARMKLANTLCNVGRYTSLGYYTNQNPLLDNDEVGYFKGIDDTGKTAKRRRDDFAAADAYRDFLNQPSKEESEYEEEKCQLEVDISSLEWEMSCASANRTEAYDRLEQAKAKYEDAKMHLATWQTTEEVKTYMLANVVNEYDESVRAFEKAKCCCYNTSAKLRAQKKLYKNLINAHQGYCYYDEDDYDFD
jgi:hypothetical protein